MKQRFYSLRFLLPVLFFLFSLQLMAQIENTRLVISDGLNDEALKQKIEENISNLLLSFNKAVINGKTPKFDKTEATSDGQKVISSLWKTSAMSCPVSKLERSCITRPNNAGYQIRNIPINMMDAPDDQFEQEIVINVLNDGRVDDIFISVTQYTDLLNASRKIEDVGMRTIVLDFVEEFRTAYNTKDIKFLDAIFSDNAIIITGKEIKVTNRKIKSDFSTQILFADSRFEYQIKNKKEYMTSLKKVFKNNKYIDVQFDSLEVIRHPNPQYPVYGVTLRQDWKSSTYMDTGYVFLLIDFSDYFNPVITVRTWQPYKYGENQTLNRNEVFQMSDFIK